MNIMVWECFPLEYKNEAYLPFIQMCIMDNEAKERHQRH